MNADVLERCGIAFGGGTRIVMSLDEYRLSKDIDLLCPCDTYGVLRQTLHESGVEGLMGRGVPAPRGFHADRYAIRTVVLVEGEPLKVEFLSCDEQRLTGPILCVRDPKLPVPVLSPQACVTTKLMANFDRGLDVRYRCRDLIDLAFMFLHWPEAMDAGAHTAETLPPMRAGETAVGALQESVRKWLQSPMQQSQCARDLRVLDEPALRQGVQALDAWCRSWDQGRDAGGRST